MKYITTNEFFLKKKKKNSFSLLQLFKEFPKITLNKVISCLNINAIKKNSEISTYGHLKQTVTSFKRTIIFLAALLRLDLTTHAINQRIGL